MYPSTAPYAPLTCPYAPLTSPLRPLTCPFHTPYVPLTRPLSAPYVPLTRPYMPLTRPLCVGMGGGTLFFSDIADEDQALFGGRSYCTTINDDVTMTSWANDVTIGYKRGSNLGGSFIHKLAIDQVRSIWCCTIPQVGRDLIGLIG